MSCSLSLTGGSFFSFPQWDRYFLKTKHVKFARATKEKEDTSPESVGTSGYILLYTFCSLMWWVTPWVLWIPLKVNTFRLTGFLFGKLCTKGPLIFDSTDGSLVLRISRLKPYWGVKQDCNMSYFEIPIVGQVVQASLSLLICISTWRKWKYELN